MSDEVAPAGDCTADEARTLIDGIRTDLADLARRVTRAFTGRAWVALGYADWATLCAAEFGGVPRLPAGERRPVVRQLTAAGMSTRAVGSALGVDNVTVYNDRRVENSTPAVVVGLDGKRYTPPPPRTDPPPIPPPPTVDPQYRAQQLLDALWRITELTAPDLDVLRVATRQQLRSELHAALHLLDNDEANR